MFSKICSVAQGMAQGMACTKLMRPAQNQILSIATATILTGIYFL